MIFRGFLLVLALLATYVLYDIARLYVIKNNAGQAPAEYSFGPEDPEFTIVEFLDYSCHTCQKTHPALKAILAQEKTLRYIPRPIISNNENGKHASRFVYAAGKQGKFKEAHTTLIESPATFGPKQLEQFIKKLKLDGDKIKADMDSPEILKQLEKNTSYNVGLGASSIPTFLINRDIFWIIGKNPPTIPDFKRVFNEARVQQ